jgi:hypothetical protein
LLQLQKKKELTAIREDFQTGDQEAVNRLRNFPWQWLQVNGKRTSLPDVYSKLSNQTIELQNSKS